jgi:hypothetical protein
MLLFDLLIHNSHSINVFSQPLVFLTRYDYVDSLSPILSSVLTSPATHSYKYLLISIYFTILSPTSTSAYQNYLSVASSTSHMKAILQLTSQSPLP